MLDPPQGYKYLLDGKQHGQEAVLKLLPGSHNLVLWAPQRRMLDTTFLVQEDRVLLLSLRLPLSDEYLRYGQQLENYRVQQQVRVFLPSLVGAGALVWTVLSARSYIKLADQLKDAEESYTSLSVPSEIRKLKTETIPELQDKTDQKSTQLFIAGTTLAASAAVVGYFLHQRRNSEPAPFEDREKLRFEGLGWAPGHGSGVWQAGLSLPIH
jgi:hypothetical protein